ncbi:MAG TPA: efflux RND transporter permease subunit [Steroidobacteraceae bacterium]|nr:efflux RND transporter permease subunit [Steroidobacteraceae bacterium]
MKQFTDLFIRRPVLSAVVSLLILVLGARAIFQLPVTQFPQTENGVITVSTAYYGADAQTVAGFITQPLEAAIAQAQGIDYLSSVSSAGSSVITATLQMNYPSSKALTEISAQVNAVRNQLPPQSQLPVISLATNQTTDVMYLNYSSKVLPANDVTDYLLRVVQPKLNAIPGVQTAEVLGGRTFALRAWLDPERMAAHGVTAADVYAALAANNYLSAAGETKGQMVSVNLTASTDPHSLEEFKRLVIRQANGAIVHLEDVATVVLGAENYDFGVSYSGLSGVFVGIKSSPTANVLTVARAVRNTLPQIARQLPHGINQAVAFDASTFINASISDVIKTLVEALLIVTAVIFLFLGSPRAAAVPAIAMPLSLVGAFILMISLGYSINLLTLLALVLAIGLVVDDAIIVVENIDRHMKEGVTPFSAAIAGARELGGPIIAMTVILVAAYAPIALQTGLTGALFTQFAFTLVGAITVSAIIALTLSPMMCSLIFRPEQEENRFVVLVDRWFSRLRSGYQRTLASWLETWPVLIVLLVLILAALPYLFMTSASELAPQEDQGFVGYQLIGPPNATFTQMQTYSGQALEIAKSLPEYRGAFQLIGAPSVSQGFGGILFVPWSERSRSANELQQVLQKKWNTIAGAEIAAFQFPSLPGAQGLPVQFVITTSEPIENLYQVEQQVLSRAKASGLFWFVDGDLKIDEPQQTIVVNHDMVAELGLTNQQVASVLGAAMGGGYVNYFTIAGRSYKVIPQVLQKDRLNPHQVLNLHIRAANGTLVQLGTIAHLERQTVPESINHFQQLNSATIIGAPAGSQGAALAFLQKTLEQVAPSGYTVDYSGQSRQYMEGSNTFLLTFGFALIIVYLALAALFESFRDPVVILVSVPAALFGALLFINIGVTSLNIYTQVGLVTLLGLISKHGILMVQFANDEQRAGRPKRAAIVEAAAVRLRPILMTTAAMVLGVLPLVLATGAGAAGRRAMGIVIFTGLSIGTIFTLFIVPAVYLLLAADHEREREKLAEPALSAAAD